MKDDFQAAADDIDLFIQDVTANASADDLKGDAEYVKSDYDELQKLCNTLLTPVPSKVVSQSAMTKVVDAKSSSTNVAQKTLSAA